MGAVLKIQLLYFSGTSCKFPVTASMRKPVYQTNKDPIYHIYAKSKATKNINLVSFHECPKITNELPFSFSTVVRLVTMCLVNVTPNKITQAT
jgi:hypothetical protein